MNKQQQGKKLLQEFERMTQEAKVRALSNVSLERPLSEHEFQEMKQLMGKLYGYKEGK